MGVCVVKLIIAIIHDDDAQNVTEELNLLGFSVTRLCSSGGFLRAGNTTLMCGVGEEHVNSVIEIIGKNSQTRKRTLPRSKTTKAPNIPNLQNSEEIVIGGATIFVVDVARFDKC